MPNYQLPEITGGVVYVPVPVDELESDPGTMHEDWVYSQIHGYLKPIPVTPVKEVEVSAEVKKAANLVFEWVNKYHSTINIDSEKYMALYTAYHSLAASLKEKGGEG